jgi:hypothetical protein
MSTTTKKETQVEVAANKGSEAPPVRKGGYRGNRYKTAVATMARELKFAGKCDGLSGFVYVCSEGKQSDRFNIVAKEIAEYVGREYRFGGDIRWTIQNISLYTEEEPKECADATAAVKKRMWERRVDEFIKREDKLKENCQSAYSLVIGQCTEYMREKPALHVATRTWKPNPI